MPQNTLTIEGIDSETMTRLTSEAKRYGVATPEFARTLLQQSLGTSPAVHHELDPLSGTWSEEDAAAFEAATGALRGIDGEIWR